jgi:hypothetical protein
MIGDFQNVNIAYRDLERRTRVAGTLDLTSLASRNNGKFPTIHVIQTLRQGSVAAHGISDMPVWGPLLKSFSPLQGSNSVVDLRIKNLTDYVKSLQK